MKIDKSIIHSIDFNRPLQPFDLNNEIFSIQRKIVFEHAKQLDNKIFEELYKSYNDLTDINTLYIIDEEEFKKFLLKYLPIYLKENNKSND